MNKTRRRHAVVSAISHPSDGPGVAVIGLGAVGTSLVRSLHRTKYRLIALVGRSREAAAALALDTGAQIASDSVGDIPRQAQLLFICTREVDIPTVVGDLLETGIDFANTIVAHSSGRETSAALSGLADRGAKTMSFHPLGSFPPGREKTFRGLVIGLEGDPAAVAVGSALARDLGAEPVEITAETKAPYHLAASLTSNYLVTLLSDVQQILTAASLPPRLTQSLAADTLLNLGSMEPESALTGPIVRADTNGLKSQLETLVTLAPELVPRFVVLAEGTIELARRSGRISSEESSKLLKILEEAGTS